LGLWCWDSLKQYLISGPRFIYNYVMNTQIIGLVGYKGSGKDTVGDHLVKQYKFRRTSFADPLKHSLAALMGWKMSDLRGVSAHSRTWRETPDAWWSDAMGIEFTPRHMMQQFGTQIVRRHIHPDFWVMRTRKQIESDPGRSWVITDVRFPNEARMIRDLGGKIVRVHRSESPEWEPRATWIHRQPSWLQPLFLLLNPDVAEVHDSERAWLADPVDHHLYNHSTIRVLNMQVDEFIQSGITTTP
jgi:hypothetical protein